MSLDLSRMYPRLRFLIQDQPDVVAEARSVWREQYPEALGEGRIQLMVHDFFTEQPFLGADVYNLRYILYVYYYLVYSSILLFTDFHDY